MSSFPCSSVSPPSLAAIRVRDLDFKSTKQWKQFVNERLSIFIALQPKAPKIVAAITGLALTATELLDKDEEDLGEFVAGLLEIEFQGIEARLVETALKGISDGTLILSIMYPVTARLVLTSSLPFILPAALKSEQERRKKAKGAAGSASSGMRGIDFFRWYTHALTFSHSFPLNTL